MTTAVRPDRGEPARAVHLVQPDDLDAFRAARPAPARALLDATGFKAKPGQVAPFPVGDGWDIAIGAPAQPDTFSLAAAAAALPEGAYRLASGAPGPATLGWLLAGYRFDRYRKPEEAKGERVLLTPEPAGLDDLLAQARATALVRDLVNTPAEHLGPAELEAEAARVAGEHGATVTVTRGDMLEQGFPLIQAVGRAAARGREPRLVELSWGDPAHPRVALIGKGVTFDTGGLDIKPASGMRLMKKDMGGAAHALALAALVMGRRLPVRLHLLLPLAENAISGPAVRPGDVLRARDGTSVEIHNTDAEGRLILADALIRAGEEQPALVLDFATLTGAARVALGPDLPALFSGDEELARGLESAGRTVDDPVWRLPLWGGYDDLLKSDIADLANAHDGGMAGAITAALFLRRFAPAGVPWAHLDTFAWRPKAKPGRPAGGDALGLRAAWGYLQTRFGRT